MVREQVRAVIELVLAALPNTSVHFLSALADGADQLFAEQVLSVKRTRERFRKFKLVALS